MRKNIFFALLIIASLLLPIVWYAILITNESNPNFTPSPTSSSTPTPSPFPTATPTPTTTPATTPLPTPTPSPSPNVTPTPTPFLTPTPSPTVIQTNASIFVSPDPVEVGAVITLVGDINPNPPSENYYYGIVFNVTSPSNVQLLLGPFFSNSTGEVTALYVPTEIGVHFVTVSYPEQVFGTDYYAQSEAGTSFSTEIAPTPTPSPTPIPTPPTGSETYGNVADHEDPADYIWDPTTVVNITLNGDSIDVNPPGSASIVGSKVTITAAATYRITGSLANGQVVVDTEDQATVRLILSGVNITCSSASPIFVKKSEKVIIILQENTENSVTDGTSYILEPDTDEPNAAIFSKANLTIYGVGSLTVNANYNDGIASKDGLIIRSGSIMVTSVDDGMRGKDYLVVKNGTITLDVGGDGLKSDNDADPAEGYVSVESGVITITCDGDAIEAETNAIITGGELDLTSGGGNSKNIDPNTSSKGIKGIIEVTICNGTIVANSADDAIHSDSNVTINDGALFLLTGDDGVHADGFIKITGGTINVTSVGDAVEAVNAVVITDGELTINSGGGHKNADNISWSAKGIKGLVNVIVNNGSIKADCADDAFHSNMNITINAGSFEILTGDDAFHADTCLIFNGGTINITKCFEGLESSIIFINNGNINIESSDDGINIVDPTVDGPADPFAPPVEVCWLHIYGGYTVVSSSNGDGVDSNGYIDMSAGVMIINGPVTMDAAVDYGHGAFNITGGTLIAVGSSGMVQGPTETSTQCSLLVTLDSTRTPMLVSLQKVLPSKSNEEIFTFMPKRTFQSIIYSSVNLVPGQYELYLGGKVEGGSPIDGLYEGGQYMPGTKYTNFTISETITTIGGGSG